MTKEQAIAFARAKYAEHPGTFMKLRPYRLSSGQWAVLCQLTPMFGWSVTDPATLDSDLEAILAAGRRWYLEVMEVRS